MKKFRSSILAFTVAMTLAASARAQQAATPPAPVGRASISSITAVQKLLTDMGIPAPPLKDTLETKTPLPLQPGTVDENKPVGVVILAGSKVPSSPADAAGSLVFAIPALSGKLTAPDLAKNAGAEPAKGAPAGVLSTTLFSLRRTPNYLLAKMGAPADIAAVPADPFASDYKQKDNLAVITLDVAALRKTLDPTLKQMTAQAQPMAAPATAPAMAYEGLAAMAAAPAMNFIDSVDKITITLAQDDQNVDLRTWISPIAAAAGVPSTMQRPVFPKGTIFVTHVIYPGGPGSRWTDAIASAVPLPDEAAKAHETEYRDFVKRALRLFAGGDAMSIGVAPRGNTATVYVVSQLHDAVDFAGEMQELNKSSKSFGMEPGETSEVTSYDAGGKKVVRISDKNPAGNSIFIDGIQDGKTLYLSFAPDDGKYVADLAAGGLKDSSNLAVAGALDLGGFVQHLAAAGRFEGIPDNVKNALLTGYAGQVVTWSMQAVPDQKAMLAQVHVPKAALKMMVMMQMMQAGGPPMPATTMPGQPPQ